jgi:hypothetical protein
MPIVLPSFAGAAQPSGSAWANENSGHFDGINDYVTVTPGSTIQLYGLSAWFKCDSVIDKNAIKGVVLGPSGSSWFLGFGGNFTSTLTDEIISINTGARYGYCDASASIAVGWHHVVAVWSTSSATNGGGDGYDIWLDGVKVGNQANTTYGAATLYTIPASTIRFGERIGAYPYPGLLDEISVFSSALSDADVATLYNSGTPGDLTDLSPAGWWRMGDNNGGEGETVTDQGSGSNDGALTGVTFSSDVPT